MWCDTGTRFQAARNPDEKEDVDAEHEDQADRFGNLNRFDSHHCSINLQRLQMLMRRMALIMLISTKPAHVFFLVTYPSFYHNLYCKTVCIACIREFFLY